jgi:hypothetical protein
MSFNDGSGSLTTQLNNAAALVNVAECDESPDEPTQTRISRKEAEHDRDENAVKNIEKVGMGNRHDSKWTMRDCKTTSVAKPIDILPALKDGASRRSRKNKCKNS